MLGMITAAAHKRIITALGTKIAILNLTIDGLHDCRKNDVKAYAQALAKKDAEIAGLMERLQGQEAVSDCLHKTIWRMDVEMAASTQVLRKAHARLAPFTTPRARDERGRFIKDQ